MKFILTLFLIFNCQDKNSFGFSKGLEPILVKETIPKSSECGTCHKEIYQDWNSSRHRVSFTNELYQDSHKKEPMDWCVNCHSPFLKLSGDVSNLKDRINKEEGISCVVCHVRDEKIIVAKIPKTQSTHTYKEEKNLGKSEFCESCHDFNFPKKNFKHGKIEYSNMVMQGTYKEYKESFYFGRESCQDCHIPKQNGIKRHYFRGGHDKDFLKKTFFAELKLISENVYELKLIAKNLGHAFPTGDLFRNFSISLLNKNKEEIYELNLRYNYKDDKNSDSQKKLISKEVFSPPIHQKNSFYIKQIRLNEKPIFYIMKMKYQTDDLFASEKTYSEMEFRKSKF